MGEVYALATAVVWAVAVIFLKRSGESLPPLALNLFRVTLSTGLLAATMLALRQPLWRGGVDRGDWTLLAASGVVGIAISDTLFHAALNRVGAGVNAIIDCLYAPFVALAAYWILGETMEWPHVAGMALVMLAILVATSRDRRVGAQPSQLAIGIGLGVLAMATVAIGIVLAKPALARQPLVWATGVRQAAAFVVLLPIALASPRWRRELHALRAVAAWRHAVPGTVLGSYVALLLWIAGMKHTATGIAAVLNQTSTIYILVFASVFLKEPFTRRRAAACLLAIAGALLVVFG